MFLKMMGSISKQDHTWQLWDWKVWPVQDLLRRTTQLFHPLLLRRGKHCFCKFMRSVHISTGEGRCALHQLPTRGQFKSESGGRCLRDHALCGGEFPGRNFCESQVALRPGVDARVVV